MPVDLLTDGSGSFCRMLCPPHVQTKSAVFGRSSSLPPLVGEGGGQVCETPLPDHFDSKQ